MKKNLEALEILEDGMYVRTNEGIDKFEYKYKHNEYDFYIYQFQKRNMSNPEFYIIGKPSFNLAELIEVGDIVKIEYQGWHQVSTKFETLKFFDDEGTEYLYDEITAIITREQLESMEYKVGE